MYDLLRHLNHSVVYLIGEKFVGTIILVSTLSTSFLFVLTLSVFFLIEQSFLVVSQHEVPYPARGRTLDCGGTY